LGNKIAPGLDLSFAVIFQAENKQDYKLDLMIVTEREKFIVPILAIGQKSLLVFPDEIHFGLSCPVKYLTEKPIIINNIGEKQTKWKLTLP
jgi:hydrocephalus-inducing protein